VSLRYLPLLQGNPRNVSSSVSELCPYYPLPFWRRPFLDLLCGERDVERVRMCPPCTVACWWRSRHLALDFWRKGSKEKGEELKLKLRAILFLDYHSLAFLRAGDANVPVGESEPEGPCDKKNEENNETRIRPSQVHTRLSWVIDG
jgi:hypothetical protein